MANKTPLSRPRWRVFRILAFGERRAKALEEYMKGRNEVVVARVDEQERKMAASILPGTEAWEVEYAAAEGGFPIVESRAPLDTVEGRLEIVLLAVTALATVLSFLGTYYKVVTGAPALLIGAFIVFICGYPILRNGIKAVFEGKFGQELLLALAVLAPLPFSYQYGQPFYYASGIIVLIAQAANLLNRYIEPRFKDMGFILPSQALNDKDEWIDVEAVKAGDLLKVGPGFRAPADGTVAGGEGTVLRPGSCIGYRVSGGSPVAGGSLDMDGTLMVKAAKDRGESKLKRVAAIMEEARKPIEVLLSYPKSIERALLLVTIMGVSFVLLFFGNMAAAVAIMLAAAPAAALIARPLSLFGCYLAASRSSAGFTSHGSIERMSMADTVAFDGLGSVSDGASLVDVAPAPGRSADDVRAAVGAYKGDDPTFTDAKEMGGYSLLSLGEASKVTPVPDDLLSKARSLESKGRLVRYAFQGPVLLGAAAFELSVPDDMKASVERLGKLGVKSIMLLSSEPSSVSDSVAKKCGIVTLKVRMDDDERLEYIYKLGFEGKNVLAAGRGCEISRFAANASAVTIREAAVGFEGLEDAVCASPADVAGLLSLSKKGVKRTSEGMSFGFYFNTIAIIAASTTLIGIEVVLLMVATSVVAIATNSARMYFSGLK